MRYIVLVLVLACALFQIHGLRIGAFNLKVFGRGKVKDKHAMNIIVQIARRYDIFFVQEIRDKSDFAVATLMAKINEVSNDYNMVISERLGRSNSKEQYVFIYRNNIGLKLKDVYQDKDLGDKFEREPFAVLFHSKRTEVKDFVLVGVHVAPKKVVPELNALDDVRDDIIRHWGVKDVILMGDMNADCRYLSKRRTKQLDLRNDGSYWLIPDEVDTTVAKGNCAYDRFIISGPQIINGIVGCSAKAYRFDTELNLTNEQAHSVSDHYPIEMEMKAQNVCGFLQSIFSYMKVNEVKKEDKGMLQITEACCVQPVYE